MNISFFRIIFLQNVFFSNSKISLKFLFYFIFSLKKGLKHFRDYLNFQTYLHFQFRNEKIKNVITSYDLPFKRKRTVCIFWHFSWGIKIVMLRFLFIFYYYYKQYFFYYRWFFPRLLFCFYYYYLFQEYFF